MAGYANKVGVHALVWTGELDVPSLRRAAEQTRQTGYDILELSLHDIDVMDLEGARRAFDEVGVEIACSRGLARDADVSSEDHAVVSRGEELLRQSVEATAALGGRILTGALYSAFGKADHPLTSKGRANVVAALRNLAGFAQEKGVTLGLEVCNRYETNVVNTARQALDLADDIGADNVMIHLDSYHMHIEETSQHAPVLEVGDRLGYMHIGENNRGMLGTGSIDFGGLFWALDKIGYRGGITFESFSSAVVSAQLSNDLAVWRNLWSDGTELARQARGFIDAHLRGAAGSAA